MEQAFRYMFKAKLISDKKYYSTKHRLMVTSMVGSLVMATPWSFELISSIWFAPLGIMILCTLYYQYKLGEETAALLENQLVINPDQVLIRSRKALLDEINVSDIVQIETTEAYTIGAENVKDLVAAFQGKEQKNVIVLHLAKEVRHFDFLIESHYMIVQLRKIIAHWQKQNIKVTTMNGH